MQVAKYALDTVLTLWQNYARSRPRRSMDRTKVSGTLDEGSIPPGASLPLTLNKRKWLIFLAFGESEMFNKRHVQHKNSTSAHIIKIVCRRFGTTLPQRPAGNACALSNPTPHPRGLCKS